MSWLDPLFAAIDIEALGKIAIVVLFFLIPAIGQLLARVKQQQQNQPPAQGPKPPRPVQPNVADEIEQFMRRAAERREAKASRPFQAPKPQPLASPITEPVKAEAIIEKPVGGQVNEHVQKYLDEQKFAKRESELGKEVAQADAQIDKHLQQVFDHRVSKLEAVPGEAATPPTAYEPPNLVGTSADVPDSFATGLLALISDPDSLRQAVILSEIIHRPEERWA
jgi:hypothetical protein